MAVWYLDNEDEITDAVARLRGTDDERVVFVVPPGSRIATGRINFKLLAREAQSRGLTMAVASPDEQVRAMAGSAGVLARVTPDEAEAALERGEQPDAPEPEPTSATAAPAATTETTTTSPGGGRLTWRSQRLRLTTVVVLAVMVVAAFVTSQTIPTAEIVLDPRIAALGPLELTVVASSDVDEPNAETGVVPAVVLAVPLAIEDAYEASGLEVTETSAQGEVVFSAEGQAFDQEIAAGTRVETPAGIVFRTTETVVLPASEDGDVSTAPAGIAALVAGEDGNVAADAISIVRSLERQGISVSNPEGTDGGRSDQQPRVTAADYDAAAVDLRNQLGGALAAYLRDPANAPESLTVFAETAALGPLTLEPPAEAVVGTAASEFTLAGSVAAEVLAVDETHIDEVARARVRAALPSDMQLVEGSISAEHEDGLVDGQRVEFQSTASARITPVIDVEELAAQVAGLPVSEAQAILDELGAATVNVWPGFLGDLPNDRQRITLDVQEASTTE